ncbi:MAG: hypothetical protein R8L07_18860 [Alphaproteobacteria bacterium]|nr:hypothetical protein [Alphaproteobacteria bacterium]
MIKFWGLCAAAVTAVIVLSGCQTGNGNNANSPLEDDDRPRIHFNASKSTDEQIADLNVCYSARNEAETEGAGYAAGGFLLGGIAGAIVASNIHDDQVQSEFTQCLSGRGYSAVIVPERLDWAAFGMETDEGRAEAIQAFNRTLSDAERQAWIEVSSQHSASSYGGFLQTYPDSVLAQEAVYRLNRLLQVANFRHEEALWEGTADGSSLQNVASSDGSTAAGVGPKVWRGTVSGDGINAYGEVFCKTTDLLRFEVKVHESKFTGRLHNPNGKVTKVNGVVDGGKIRARFIPYGTTVDYVMRGIIDGNRISGDMYPPGTTSCSATFTLQAQS